MQKIFDIFTTKPLIPAIIAAIVFILFFVLSTGNSAQPILLADAPTDIISHIRPSLTPPHSPTPLIATVTASNTPVGMSVVLPRTPTNTPTQTIGPSLIPGSPSTIWGMSAANPQRTSWVAGTSNELKGNLSVAWYRVIDPYIDNKVQVIASDNKVFVSTSKGLYAFNANNGTQMWVYGTELPLGNSPTYFNGVLYVGGYDHKIHAINSSDGQLKAGWGFLEAGAGFETNPAVISDVFTNDQPTILAGNRDGYFYAIDGDSGNLKWKYQTGGPIRFSAAYKDGVVYFASDDSYAYALNVANGSLVWKSAKLPGVGFDNYWPVIYTDSISGNEYVLYSGSKKADWSYFGDHASLYFEENYKMFENQSGCTGTTTLNCSVITNYFNAHPWKRHLFILNADTGSEYTPYAPVNWAGVTHNGNKYPPIVSGDGQLYSFIGYKSGGNNGANGWVAQWKIGSSTVKKIYNNNSGAADEPTAFTSGGNLIYWGEGVNADIWGTVDITKPIGSNFYSWQELRSLPGAGAKYTSLDLTGKFGGNNGVYGYFDGLTNLSPIPYQEKLFIINGNVLFALSRTGEGQQLPTANVPDTMASGSLATTPNDIKQKLAVEIQKILTAGHLRPGYADSGIPSGYFNYHGNTASVPGNHIGEYFHNPADTLYTLSIALPYLSPSLQEQVKEYMQTEQINYPVQSIAHIGWNDGSSREAFIDPPEMTGVFTRIISDDGNYPFVASKRTTIWYPNPCCNDIINVGTFPQDSFYGAWKYAQATMTQAQAKNLFDSMKGKLQKAGEESNDLTNDTLQKYPYILNQYIAGYRGYLELEKLAGYTININQSTQYAEYTRLLNLRINDFDKDAPNWPGINYNNNLSVARNFMFLVPELAQELRASKLTQVQNALNEYETIEAYWFVSRYDRTFNEGVFQPLYDYHALFQAKAYILQEPYNELVKYLDIPAFEKGDLYYIQNLVALLQSTE
jgi:outer membrane protein assembly factor BamB